MSLELFTDREEALKQGMELNVLVDFAATKLKGSRAEAAIIAEIDEAEQDANDPYTVIDRFGYKRRITELSAGSLSALTVINNPDKLICGLQMGDNALECLLHNCKEGKLLIFERQYSIDGSDGVIDVIYHGKHYDNTYDLKNAMGVKQYAKSCGIGKV